MQVVQTIGDDALATVFVAELSDGARIEFVESVQPPIPRDEKWVLIVSTLKGCPVGCPICDAGGHYLGRLGVEEILGQIEYLVRRRFPDGRVPVRKVKVQFARMGDPALNPAVLEVLETLPRRLHLPGLLPSLSTIAPAGCERFFEDLLALRRTRYRDGRFQLQFSVHTTCDRARRALVPARTWSLQEMAAYGDRFTADGGRKVTLNFAPVKGFPLDPGALAPLFSRDRFLIKLTPVNPTQAARRSGLEPLIDPDDPDGSRSIADRFRAEGYEVIVSIGELRENEIGSNCGMFVGSDPTAAAARRYTPAPCPRSPGA